MAFYSSKKFAAAPAKANNKKRISTFSATLSPVEVPSESVSTAMPFMKTAMVPQQLVLSSSYRINKSYSKLVDVGLAWEYGHLQPVVRITDSNHRGITFSVDVWDTFRKEVPNINSHFDSSSDIAGQMNVEAIDHKDFAILFTTSYSDKAVVISEPLTDSQSDNPASPSIVLKKVTFDNLVKLIPCIGHRLKYLLEVQKVALEAKLNIVEFMREKYKSENHFTNLSVSDAMMFIMRMYDVDLKTDVFNKFVQTIPSHDGDVYEIVVNELLAMFPDELVIAVRMSLSKKRPHSDVSK